MLLYVRLLEESKKTLLIICLSELEEKIGFT